MNANGISTDPTMNDYSSHIVDQKEGDGDNIKLHQKFEVLEQEWESYVQSIPRTVRRYSTDNSVAMAKAVDQLLDSSPSNFISSLQQKWSPPKGGHWKIRTNDLAAEEMLRERRLVIESGRLKGRRLFQAVEDETEMVLRGSSSDDDHEKVYNKYGRIHGINLVQEISTTEVRSVPFYDSDHEPESGVSNELPGGCFHCCSSSSSSSPSHQNVEIQAVEEEKKVQATSVERRRVAYNGRNGNINNGRRWMVFMGWFAFASIIYAVFIAPMRIFGGYGDEHHEMLLVPT
ncbi:hypothetical protein I3843_12G044500 [Carya illinoinensis]|nr:hypothetical protein I3843_12G044500 [Carya illinoinensis]